LAATRHGGETLGATFEKISQTDHMWTVEEIRENYRKFEDWKIRELAQNPSGLRKEIVPILIEEIKKRNLDIELITWVNYETNKFEGFEKKDLIKRILNSKCSLCNLNSNLKGYKFNTLISVLINITDKSESLIICNDCARKKRLNSMLKTFFLGWWSKRGIISTPFTLISDLINIFKKESVSKEIIDDYIENNTGMLRLSLEKNNLNEMIAEFNNSQMKM